MSRTRLAASLSVILAGGAAHAEVPRVVVDVAPAHSLVARVMEGLGTPELIVQPGASPHGYALRPSEAAALQEADLVFRVGPALTPWLDDAQASLAPDATVTALMEVEGTTLLPLREGALFEAHGPDEHGHAEEGHDEAAHDEAADEHADGAAGEAADEHDHAQDEAAEVHDEAAHDDHAEGAHDGHDHAEGAGDAHAWLSPANAAVWLDAIAAQLSEADPENAVVYAANAEAGRAELDALSAEVEAMLAPVRGGRFVVFHDAYQYFEDAFDMPAAGAISLSDATAPGPARIAEIRERVAEEGIDCVLAEPQFNPGLVATVLDGTQAATGVLDPLGADLEPGPALYPQLVRNLASALAGCL